MVFVANIVYVVIPTPDCDVGGQDSVVPVLLRHRWPHGAGWDLGDRGSVGQNGGARHGGRHHGAHHRDERVGGVNTIILRRFPGGNYCYGGAACAPGETALSTVLKGIRVLA